MYRGSMDAHALSEFIHRHPSLFVLTGAGVSTDSGIPDYRDHDGEWKRAQPVTYQAFMGDERTRRRYWARSLIGWRHFGKAAPNRAHRALANLEQQGKVGLLVTQNVDCLHQAAGSGNVVDLHGRLDAVRCMSCEQRISRHDMQEQLLALNPDWAQLNAREAPDGDADLEGRDFSAFDIPECQYCGGVLKPDVVFFGESVPRDRVDRAFQGLQASRCDARRRVIADGLFGLSVCAGGSGCWQTHRGGQSGANSGGFAADLEDFATLWRNAQCTVCAERFFLTAAVNSAPLHIHRLVVELRLERGGFRG